MTHQAPISPAAGGDGDPAMQIARLREALALVRRLSGESDPLGGRPDEGALIAAAHASAAPIVQRRFDTLCAETAAWTAGAVDALLPADGAMPSRAAASRLAGRLDRALFDLRRLIGL
jgi:hypothetical protein